MFLEFKLYLLKYKSLKILPKIDLSGTGLNVSRVPRVNQSCLYKYSEHFIKIEMLGSSYCYANRSLWVIGVLHLMVFLMVSDKEYNQGECRGTRRTE